MTFLSMAAFRRPLIAAGLLVGSATACAHITLASPQAEAGSYYTAVLRVGHGCDGAAITEIIVTLPPGVQGAKPMPKPGWRIDIERAPLAVPVTSHGRTVTEDVSRVRWTGGPLPDAYYDEFVLRVRLPDTPGRLYWPVTQVCEQGRIDWVEVPDAAAGAVQLTYPAPMLELRPAAPPAQHAH